MSLLSRFFYRRPPDGLLEFVERVYVFDSCFSTDVLPDEMYQIYLHEIITELHEEFHDSSFLAFNFREGERRSHFAEIVSDYDVIVMDYPRHYEGCPVLPLSLIQHFLRVCDNWLMHGNQQNVILLHCERGGWPLLAFLLSSFLIYRKLHSGERRTLEIVHKEAPKGLLQLLSPLNPFSSQLRYLQYVARRNISPEWPPPERALSLDCLILRAVPSFDSHNGCRPLIRIWGRNLLSKDGLSTHMLFTMAKNKKSLRHYNQADCDVIKIDIQCFVQGDVVLECIHVDLNPEREVMMFRIMFNTAFIRSNILMLNYENLDILWDSKERYPRGFRAEVLFGEAESLSPRKAPTTILNGEEKGGLPIEAFSKVQELFNGAEWVDNGDDAALWLLKELSRLHGRVGSYVSPADSEEENNTSSTADSMDFESEKGNNIVTNYASSGLNNVDDPLSEGSASEQACDIFHKPHPNSTESLISTTANAPLPSSESDAPHDIDCSPMTSNETFHPFLNNTGPPPPPPPPPLHPPPPPPFSSSNGSLSSLQTDISSSANSKHPPSLTIPNGGPVSPPPPLPPSFLSISQSSTLQRGPPPPPPPPSLQVSAEGTPTPPPPPPLPPVMFKVSQTVPPPPPPPNLSTIRKPSHLPPPPPPPLPTTQLYVGNTTNKLLPPLPPPPPPPLPTTQLYVGNTTNNLLPPPPLPSPPFAQSSRAPPPPPPPLPKNSYGSGPPALPPHPTSHNSMTTHRPPPPPPPPLTRNSNNSNLPPPPPPPPLTRNSNNSNLPPPPPPPPKKYSIAQPQLQGIQPPTAPPPPLGRVVAPAPPPPPGAKGSNPPPPLPSSIGKGRSLSVSTSQGKSRSLGVNAPKKASLKPLHWVKVTRAMQGSLWADSNKQENQSRGPDIDILELESLFSAVSVSDRTGADKGGGRRGSNITKPEKVQLIDLRRAYNCEIMLTKIKIPLPDMINAILALDSSTLDIDQVENLIKFCPTKEEMELLKNYSGSKDMLGKCEQVPRVESKLRVFSFKITFSTQVNDLRKNLSIINHATKEVKESAKLRQIMQTILTLGNALNQGTARGSAIGFKLDSLLKLSDTRAKNNKMTLMHYLCKLLSEKLPELLDFDKDLVHLEAASKIQLKNLAEEMQAVSKGLEKVEQELAASDNDGDVSLGFQKVLQIFLHTAEAEVRSLISLYSEVGRSADSLSQYFGEDPARCPFEQVTQILFVFVKMFNKSQDENEKLAEAEKRKLEKEEAIKERASARKESGDHERSKHNILSQKLAF